MQLALDWIGRQFAQGSLEFRAANGRVWKLGHSEPCAVLNLHDPSALRRILFNPQLALGETYMDGAWEPADGDLHRMMEVSMCMLGSVRIRGWQKLIGTALNQLREINTPRRSRRNAHHHYDLGNELYAAFLDQDLHYSCAYFPTPDLTLEVAQQAKCAHVAAKLDLKPGARVLDIGCGWGSLAMYLAEHHDVHVTGVTLSTEQLKAAQARAADRGLGDRVDFRLQDYRKVEGSFDAIVSVGMFEHVGRPQYPTFFDAVCRLLKPDGTALIHTIGRSTPPGRSSPWIDKYIFPGGYVPAASETIAACESSGLILTDLEVWRLHYAQTLVEWQRRFQSHRAEFQQSLGERFCRMWEFYLAASEASFRWGNLVVFHLQLTRQLDRLPLSRNYLYCQK